MPESMNSDSLQQQIVQIEKDLTDKRAQLEQQKLAGQISELPHEKAILKEVVGDIIHSIPGPVPIQSTQNDDQEDDTVQQIDDGKIPMPSPQVEPPLYLTPELKNKIQELVNLSFTKSIDYSVKMAQKSNNAALIDAFHDALVDELYEYLVSQGKLKKL